MSTRAEILAGLAPHVRAQAGRLIEEFGSGVVRLTSGFRTLRAQAGAMAPHVHQNRQWIAQTYRRIGRPSYEVGQRLQQAVGQAPEGETVAQIRQRLYAALVSDPFGSLISKHCVMQGEQPAALAFDLDPLEQDGKVTAMGAEVWSAIVGLQYLDPPPLRREGGRIVWHVQFTPLTLSTEV